MLDYKFYHIFYFIFMDSWPFSDIQDLESEEIKQNIIIKNENRTIKFEKPLV